MSKAVEIVSPAVSAARLPSPPRPLLECWAELRPSIRAVSRVCLFSDFDGTLTPIARRPEDAQLSPAAREILAKLSRSGAVIGIVSGRGVEDLRGRVGLRGVWYAGEHGFVLYRRGCVRFIDAEREDAILRAGSLLSSRLMDIPGIFLDPKEATFAVHYRLASAEARATARGVIAEVLNGEPGLRVLRGKKVWEIAPDMPVNKWTAIRYILRHEFPRSSRALIYIGDDKADEEVFANMKGVTVAVGRNRKTSARFYLRSPSEVRRFLNLLAEEPR